MKMKVNVQVIKTLRDSRCYSQEQLAEMSGLSLRTVQRIEAKGVASLESIKSIAAALDIDCQQLLALDHSVHVQGSASAAAVSEHIQTPATKTDSETASAQAPQEQAAAKPKANKHSYLWSMLLVIAANGFGFWGIFDAYHGGRIDHETMSLLKNLVSLALLSSVGLLAYKGYKEGIFK
ncbi:helix-turn-helix transcriptional regulator [Pseudoalteromonas sp. BDTF-M6]|uniref:helix-turn-helix domain-containing protein n=1 Tax=Pseudoalteromonas sp. BDTF-M6 TaxID=2796132 RepID=UPI001BAEA30E|nr:helix-turn-helix transcriptional regulator [Pseudoalteromonas sp. BDTF-M6]MBS3796459.1 helix-turn-helix transcriptional regulator [Pseudoalteromonas sp. BDTF-M6]